MTESYRSVFPQKTDPLFSEKLEMLEDFGIFKIPENEKISDYESFEKKASSLCQFEKTYYQHLVSQYISQRSPYRSLLLYHGLGSGKTCSAITIAETFLKNHRLYEEPFVWIISKKALKKSFEKEVFRTVLLTSPEFLREQCTGDAYYQMIPDATSLPQDKLVQRIQKIIKSRYKFFGYEKFANTIEEYIEEGTLEEKIKDKVIIIDEAHNIRNLEAPKDEEEHKNLKKIIEPIIKFIQMSQNNRLVLLSATPMFNEPEEILWLMSLLALNDKQTNVLNPFHLPSFFTSSNRPVKQTFELMKQLASYYISYVRGNNPFTFAVRLSPRDLGISVIDKVPSKTFQGVEIPKIENNWISYIKDGIVPSVLSGVQLENMIEMQKHKDKLVTAKLRQLNNITYRKQLTKNKFEYVEGKTGIFSVFKKREGSEEGGVSQFEYINPKEPILNPHDGKLKGFATKLATLSEFITKSEGIVVIYSNFVWGGVVPVAIMLEHMGFSRYGEKDLLHMQKKVTKSVRYKDITNPQYCILSGENEKDIMGSSKIDDLLEVINHTDKNKNGKQIKVVIMSPVASEGLSFKNIREIHILDPWYHLNTTEQAIGRAIRHCSHSSLPLDERNVTVFLHATVFPENTYETEDLHAYRLAAMKSYQIESVNQIVKENAMDCSLLTHVNYFPKDMFEFQTTLKTSHGNTIPYQFGDDESLQIKCKHMQDTPRETRAFREESYASFIPTLQQKLRKILKDKYEQKQMSEFTYEELKEMIHPNQEVSHKTIEQSLYPYKLWGDYGMIYHYNKFIISNFSTQVLRPTRLQIETPKETILEKKEDACHLEEIMESFALDSEAMATLKLYQTLDSHCWKSFAEKLIKTPESISKKIYPLLAILDKQGALVRSSELPLKAPGAYCGYINLFSEESVFEGSVWDDAEKHFREILPSELERIKKQRVYVPFTDPSKMKIIDTIAMIQRYKNAKDPSSPYRFQFKLGLNNEKVKRSGIVCDAGLKKPEIEKELSKFVALVDAKGNKMKLNISQMCFQLILELYKVKRIWIPSSYKPK
jgi:hypothetical protein